MNSIDTYTKFAFSSFANPCSCLSHDNVEQFEEGRQETSVVVTKKHENCNPVICNDNQK